MLSASRQESQTFRHIKLFSCMSVLYSYKIWCSISNDQKDYCDLADSYQCFGWNSGRETAQHMHQEAVILFCVNFWFLHDVSHKDIISFESCNITGKLHITMERLEQTIVPNKNLLTDKSLTILLFFCQTPVISENSPDRISIHNGANEWVRTPFKSQVDLTYCNCSSISTESNFKGNTLEKKKNNTHNNDI
jgi:hypothetical protein